MDGKVTPNATTFVCETCTRCHTVADGDREVAVVVARREGWTVDYHGPGHGSLSWCPQHADEAFRAQQQKKGTD